ncbi:putative metal-dependent peptidase [Acidovorax soli]|uniref:Putative metal-dependent peptidase n=1 Tax=Acidovorax soli TaxID=592050 RepID=A0A7X0PG41_9BURK|nr:VWA-like domain-containing protein [Acidovorax soli]MBB6560917.1 putative metal-dependent peptidase [Acidovorax soli]
MAKTSHKPSPATLAYDAGMAQVLAHPIFGPLARRVSWVRAVSASQCPPAGWLVVLRNHCIHVHPKRNAPPDEWAFVLARGVLGYAMELFQRDRGDWPQWCAACDVASTRFLASVKFGQCPADMQLPADVPAWDEERWYRQFCESGVPPWAESMGLAGPRATSLQAPEEWPERPATTRWGTVSTQDSWSEVFAAGIANSVAQAVEIAAGTRAALGGDARSAPRSTTERARSWFISSFPLLGSMVAAFDILEDAELCRREEIMVGAVDETLRTIYLNPAAGLTEQETRFVIAHEILHVALRHMGRRQGRDPYLWNVACDYVINDWLIQMQVGSAPALGLLHDLELRGLSAEEVYDRIVVDLRRMRKLLTLAGRQGDMLDRRLSPGQPGFTDLDAFYKEQLGKGLMLHESQGRGLLPAALLEEIRALLQPPIPWEVELARWFDHHFPPIETRRTYTRLSRRQSATPDIPRPQVGPDPRWLEGRTFGVVLDTSGSMDRHTLAKALGSIAGYAQAKEVPAVRVVCCDAAPYDLGYLEAQDIAHRVEIKGRGGTVLQPAITLLENSADFPEDGPLLIITDADCDRLSVRRSHAYLLAAGRRLPFMPSGDVFYMT